MVDMIYKRKSVRSYREICADKAAIEKINEFISGLKPLYPDIKVRADIVDKSKVKCILPWITPQLIAVYSEQKPGMYENAGFMFQQLDLYLQSIGMGVCWLGMGKMNNKDIKGSEQDNLKFVILLAFGYPHDDPPRSSTSEFRRKALSEICDIPNPKLEPARLAPSSVNSQPWYFTHENNVIHAYRSNGGLINTMLGDMNRIDMGIALAHMYVANPDTFCFFKSQNAKNIKGYKYTGSFTI